MNDVFSTSIASCNLKNRIKYPVKYLVSGISKSEQDYQTHLSALKISSAAGKLSRNWNFGDFYGYAITFDNQSQCEEYLKFATTNTNAASQSDNDTNVNDINFNVDSNLKLTGIEIAAPFEDFDVDYMVPWVFF